MTTIWRFLKVFTLGTWVGSMIFFAFFVAPILFSTLKDMDQAGTLVGLLLWRLHIFGIIAAIVYLAAALAAARSWRGLAKLSSVLVSVMFLATLVSQVWIMPAMDNLRMQMGSYMNTPAGSPLRVQFDRLHLISVRLESGVLILGLMALFLTVWRKPSPALPGAGSVSAPASK